MYDQLTGPPEEWDEEYEDRCPKCGSDNIFFTKDDTAVCRDCWHKDDASEFNFPKKCYPLEIKKGE